MPKRRGALRERGASPRGWLGLKEEVCFTELINLYNGECLEVLKQLPDACVDAVITDPPAGISFMGAEWDGHKGGRDKWIAWLTVIMVECLRVLKPGGHALVWALPRTSHWTAAGVWSCRAHGV